MFDSPRGEEERDPGGRNNIKPGIVTDSRRPQCMTFIQNYGDTRKLVDGIFTFNFSDHFCA